ncbi:FadR/GntR family transcriptional regulator [Gordonia sp. ABSL11-1]|uniref:FadR/GntR family transcriptional regulator n=1 Tax=Gordonia sp. ABSL11-1 TaxID=3053924 RepID=UPI002572D147|nr:FadR/GntR family transcriptional regulator [Gordonia sp. ABSL11-1]MDL9948494.1 FadR/GntR family transcriptional regulator [Gordonia sp. ABSL11-1]
MTQEVRWQPLQRLRTHEQVIAEIEHRLSTGALAAGDRLPPERQLAEALGVSRGAVREALRILEAIGVVEAGTGSGPTAGSTIVRDSFSGLAMVLRIHMQVASFERDDLLEVRLSIERLASRKAARAATSEDIDELRALVERMRGVDSVATFNDLDAAFHIQIATISGNDLVAVLMAAMRQALRDTMVTAFEQLTDPQAAMRKLTNEHSKIVDAISSGAGTKAANAVGRHICGFYEAVGFTISDEGE